MTREELELHTKWLEVEERFIAAKLADRNSDEYRAAKAEMNDLRVYWRQIRECFPPDDGVARPAPIRATSKVMKKG